VAFAASRASPYLVPTLTATDDQFVPPRARRRRATALLILLLLFAAAALYLVGNGRVALWDRDEPRYAQTSRQMLRSGDWIVPKFLGEPREKKPVFIYWCQAAAMRVVGDDAFAARLPSAMFVTLTLALIATTLYRAVGPRRALWTTFIFATSALAIAAAKMCITDGVLILFVTASQICLFAMLNSRGSWRVAAACGFAMGMGLLTKGPVVPAVMLMTGLTLFVMRRFDPTPFPHSSIPWLKWLAIVVSGLALYVALWGFWIERRLPGYHVRTIIAEVLARTARAQEGHKGPPGYYLLTIWGTFFPWSLLLPATVVQAWRRRHIPIVRFCLAAVVGPWLMFEIVQTKLPHYLLPIFPPLAFLTADMLVRASRRLHQDITNPAFPWIVFAWGIIVVLVASLPWLAVRTFGSTPSLTFAMFILTILSIEYARQVWLYFRARRVLDAAAVMGIGMMAFVAVLYSWYLPRADFLRISPRVADVLIGNGATKAGDEIMIDYKEPSLAFYQGGTIREQTDDDYLVKTDPILLPPWVVVTDRIWRSMPEEARARYTVVGTVRGWWYANKGQVVDVLVLRKRADL
jgi:4-amino-4-deoxy-L-arabinose transferase-like glycosyltransferase